MSATARIVGGAALIAVGVVLATPTGGASLSLAYAGAPIAAGGVCRRLPPRGSA